jgi:hypothetical protein
MWRNLTTALSVALLLSVSGTLAWAESAADAFSRGEGLLKKGDLEGALAAYATAARTDRENQEYLQHYTILRRIMQLRKGLDEEQDLERVEEVARALHAFYVNERLYAEALSLGRVVHAKLNNEWSGVSLAETQLALSLNDDAAKTLGALAPKESSPMAQALLGIALVRSGKAAQAKRVAEAIVISEQADPQSVYAAARLSAGLGEKAKALKLLGQCLQSAPPSQQEGFKEHAKRSPEFAAMANGAEFAAALATKSNVPESKCSGGKSCAGCPMRGKCPGSQGH